VHRARGDVVGPVQCVVWHEWAWQRASGQAQERYPLPHDAATLGAMVLAAIPRPPEPPPPRPLSERLRANRGRRGL
jgi:hypothetical protein